ncbi:MAG TPA: RsmE family RNA methyltransferase, partial [Chitinophagaceae bacterium]|nr:RsmE family RNA methyltransferase [Chitinophagaceae bacterium]
MTLPFFYINSLDASKKSIELDEDTSRHVVQVLRMKEGKQINLTDGKGNLITAEISDAHKKHCTVEILDSRFTPHVLRKISIAISLLKNTNRFEWFLEKATEIGVAEIIPLICERTEKQKFRFDRMKGICISAMLQSQQCWLPVLHETEQFNHLVIQQIDNTQKFIAHCNDSSVKQNLSTFKPPSDRVIRAGFNHSTILIGPEGDFTKEEIELALQNDFIPVSLGETRLRTETAGVVAAAVLKNFG